MKTGDAIFGTCCALFLVGFFTFVGIEQSHSRHDAEVQNKFAGACDYVGGTVHDDLCIKDGRVVITRGK